MRRQRADKPGISLRRWPIGRHRFKMGSNQRKKNLIRPALQLKLTLVFLVTSGSMMSVLGYLVLSSLDGRSVGETEILPLVMDPLLSAFWTAMAIMVFATLLVGTLATFLVAGPLYRLETFLESVIQGEKPRDCKVREGDELTRFCELLNKATEPLRCEFKSSDTESGSDDQADAA
ncbi:MAG: hypothetical protein ACI9F9_001184 [Candidatus Paceibacteria bacterium]|jgi:hypothetical protein